MTNNNQRFHLQSMCWWRAGDPTSRILLAASLAMFAVGCFDRAPRLRPPKVNAGAAAATAIETYDDNDDGVLDSDELQSCPSLRAARQRFDTDQSQTLSADEISARIAQYAAEGIGAQSVMVTVTLGGQPLAGATVTFEPETFLGSEFKSAAGTTGRDGSASPVMQDSNLPGMQLGLYRVKISKRDGDRETIPDRYNTNTELAHELTFSPDSFQARFDLTSP